MRFVPASRAGFPHLTGISATLLPTLRRFAMECGAVATCIAAYMVVLAIVAIGGVAVVSQWNFGDSLSELHLDTVLGADAPHEGETPAVACLSNRPVLLKAGNDAGLAELFARAELRRPDCGSGGAREAGDWIVSAQNPRLRGAL
ncbi:MAG: hypothetical protein ACTHNN_17960 [Xanthobacteraceae bacterium]